MSSSATFAAYRGRLRKRAGPIIPVFTTCLYLLILFLCIISYMYGSLFRSTERAHNLKILVVDFDGGIIGQALRAAYTHLQSPSFPTLQYQSEQEFPDITSAAEQVCSHGYWAVVYTHPGASQRLLAAVAGNNTTPYNANDTITYVYSDVYYPVIAESFIFANLQALTAATTQVLYSIDGVGLLQHVNQSAPAAVSALFRPITASPNVLFPTDGGARVLFNTITMVVPPLMQFFYVMALDHISVAMSVYTKSSKRRVYLERLAGNKAFSFMGGLIVASLIYAFREDWVLTGAQFVETWFCFWFYMDISYLVMDSFIGTVVPMRFAPFFIFTWVILSVTSTLFPFELNPGFYRWAYALPAHNVWLLLMTIWSKGCNSMLDVALPVCFMWWFFGHITSAFAVRRKCTEAEKARQQKGGPLIVSPLKELDFSTQDMSLREGS